MKCPVVIINGFLIFYLRFRHQNILEIMGYCFCSELKALVYRYMENGSLYLWIHKVKLYLISWIY